MGDRFGVFRRCQELLEERDRSIRGALLLEDSLLGAAAEVCGISTIGQAAADERFELLFVLNNDSGIAAE